ncbi:hypothetical protein ACFLZV_01645 [Candidatus Margulisiibacteriota bacterium]
MENGKWGGYNKDLLRLFKGKDALSKTSFQSVNHTALKKTRMIIS